MEFLIPLYRSEIGGGKKCAVRHFTRDWRMVCMEKAMTSPAYRRLSLPFFGAVGLQYVAGHSMRTAGHHADCPQM